MMEEILYVGVMEQWLVWRGMWRLWNRIYNIKNEDIFYILCHGWAELVWKENLLGDLHDKFGREINNTVYAGRKWFVEAKKVVRKLCTEMAVIVGMGDEGVKWVQIENSWWEDIT